MNKLLNVVFVVFQLTILVKDYRNDPLMFKTYLADSNFFKEISAKTFRLRCTGKTNM